MNSIDIDVGGTFTDLVLNFGGQTLIKKVPTTPYDLSVCFSRVIEEGAAARNRGDSNSGRNGARLGSPRPTTCAIAEFGWPGTRCR